MIDRIVFVILVLQFFIEGNYGLAENKTSVGHSIQKRGYPSFLFPINACTGILVAIAVPLVIPNRNIFVSYNFEANYNMANLPYESYGYLWYRWNVFERYNPVKITTNSNIDSDFRRSFKGTMRKRNTECEENSLNEKECNWKRQYEMSVRRPVINRKSVYQIIENRLDSQGLYGKKCLLRAICESAKLPLHENNGVIGHVFHVLLTPSTSKSENLPREYEKAEFYGSIGKCRKYEKYCPVSILDLITTITF